MLTIMSGVFFYISVFAVIAIVALTFVGMARKKPDPDTRPWQQKTRFWILGAAIVWAVTLIISFAVPRDIGISSEVGDTADSDAAAYTQTWGKDYADTTCGDWNAQMTDEQQFAAAADILASAWDKIEGSSDFPSDSLITEFQGGISKACIEDTMTLTDVSYGVYTTEPRFEP